MNLRCNCDSACRPARRSSEELKENAFFLCPRWILALNHYHFSPGDAEKASPFFFLARPDNGLFQQNLTTLSESNPK